MRSRAVLGCITAVAALAVAGCGTDGSGEPPASSSADVGAPAEVTDGGRLSFCTDATFPPFEFKQGAQTVGLDVEIGEEIAERLGAKAEFVQTGFDAIIAALSSGRCDAIIAGMTVTPEREGQVDFVRYLRSGQSIMLKAGAEHAVERDEDLAGLTVAVQTGSVHGDRLRTLNDRLEADGKPKIDIVAFPGNTEAASALRADRIDAFVSDYPQLAYLAREAPDDFEVVESQTQVEPLGIALAKDRGELRDAIVKALADAYRDGSIDAVLEKWNAAELALPEGDRPS